MKQLSITELLEMVRNKIMSSGEYAADARGARAWNEKASELYGESAYQNNLLISIDKK